MADDPYKILGVARGASADDIRRAYRKLAKENHPDLNPESRLASEEKLKIINGAFAILGEEEKRRQFDAGAIDANGEPRPRYQRAGARSASADDYGFNDIFSDLFGRGGRGGAAAGGGFGEQFGGPTKGADVRYTLEVEFLEAALGAKKRVTLPDGGQLDLQVPEGVSDGRTLRLKGKGKPSARGAEAGDALVEIKVKAHARFRRESDDLLLDVPISIDEAVLGGKIEVPTLSGRVQLTIPKGTNSGRAFRLKGKGFKGQTGTAGDEIITVRIELPEVIDEKLAYFLSEWRLSHSYNPRKD
ncbi:MAG: J domain-containing protein [Hyphomicrobiaceae bacterium]|nr:J domain-containing protein [Hyphomicrobiaceae bacterium]